MPKEGLTRTRADGADDLAAGREFRGGGEGVGDFALGDFAQGGVFGGEFFEGLDERAAALAELFDATGDHVDQDHGIIDDQAGAF